MSTDERQCADSQKVGSRIIHLKALASSKLMVHIMKRNKCDHSQMTFVSGQLLLQKSPDFDRALFHAYDEKELTTHKRQWSHV